MSGIPSCSENTSRLTASLYRMRIFMFSVYRSKKNRPQRASLTTCKARLQRLTPSPDLSGWSAGAKRFPARPEAFSGVSRFGPSWLISTLCSSRWFSSSPASFGLVLRCARVFPATRPPDRDGTQARGRGPRWDLENPVVRDDCVSDDDGGGESPVPGILDYRDLAAAGDADQLGHRDGAGAARRGARRGVPPQRSADRIRTR